MAFQNVNFLIEKSRVVRIKNLMNDRDLGSKNFSDAMRILVDLALDHMDIERIKASKNIDDDHPSRNLAREISYLEGKIKNLESQNSAFRNALKEHAEKRQPTDNQS